MKFLSRLRTESIPGSDSWLLTDHLVYLARDGRVFRAPKGSETDFFSIPGLLRGLFFRARKYSEPAVMHDSGYRGTLQERVDGVWVPARVDRKYIDKYLLKDGMRCIGAREPLVSTIYSGVRLGGRASYKG